ncbi:MAG TPA: hypothetical protein VF549_19970 [Solirubrobacteraceae bacterium]
MSRLARISLLSLLLIALAAAAGAGTLRLTGDDDRGRGEQAAARECKDGEKGESEEREREERGREEREEREREEREEREREECEGKRRGEIGGGGEAAALYAGPKPQEPPCGERPGLPEPFADLAKMNSSIASRSVAPGTMLKPGAYRAALRAAADLPQTGGDWKPYGRAPLETGRTEYDVSDESTQLGLGNVAGRLTAYAVDPATGRLFAVGSNGGVWTSTDNGENWTSIGENLPTQTTAGIAWTSAGGGTLIVLTGDGAFAGSAYTGIGAYWTTDMGATWNRAGGIPDGLVGFKLAVDPTNASVVYAATGGGLFRSTNAGRDFANVNLPTGEGVAAGQPDCTGKLPSVKGCYLANMVTDVVVQYPDNDATDDTTGKPGAVLAAAGWRRGTYENKDGTVQAPNNGLYRSDTGAPDTFENVHIEDPGNNAPLAGDTLNKDQLGRIELGVAKGPDQDHEFVYAIIQDAVKFNGGAGGLDVSEQGIPNPTYLNGVWVSPDFGKSEGTNEWRELEGANSLSNDPTRESALTVACQAPIVLYCPGVQSWYNLWVEPDPTRADASGVPTRLAFGLEEVWADDPAVDNPLDGTSPMHAKVVGRYYAGNTCGILIVLNLLPVCPTQPAGVPEHTTHPDQHGALWIPDGSGGVTLHVANDGGHYSQKLGPTDDLSNDNWTHGSSAGMNTLQPYDLAIARDGTVYMGLQDNGETKIDPDGRTYTVFGGDGFFSAVEPDNPDHAYEEYTYGVVNKTTDGGKNWEDITPTNITSAPFSTPIEMDPNDPKRLVMGGRDVEETTAGSETESDTWTKVYDLGTRKHPGDPDADASSDDEDSDNVFSAVDTRSFPAPPNAPLGPHTPDEAYTAGATTAPGGQELTPGTFPPGTYEDHPVKLGPDAGNAFMRVRIQWASKDNDWDLYVYRKESDGSLTEVASSTEGTPEELGGSGATDFEQAAVPNPPAGDYVVRVVNFNASGTVDAKITFEQRVAGSEKAPATYVGFCGYCDTITQGTPFGNGIATNVGGSKPAKAGTGDGWHVAKAAGLPRRLITSVRMDPSDTRTIYVTLAGYARRWAAPGSVSEDVSGVGTGHVFKSTDAGETFTDVSGNLPDVPADWSALHDGQLIVGTDLGVFISCDTTGGSFSRLGRGLPNVPVSSLRFKPGDPDLLFVATFGRGAYTYRFTEESKRCGADKAPPPPNVQPVPGPPPPTSCSSLRGFKSVRVRQVKSGLRFFVARQVKAPFTIDVFRESTGRKVLTERRVAHFPMRTRGLIWRRGKKAGNGYYFARFIMRSGGASDARRIALLKSRGRFRVRPGFHASRRCKLIRLARLTRPVFGGRTRKPLRVSTRLNAPGGSVTITIRRGRKVIARKRFARAGTSIRRFTVRDRRAFRRGDYRATVVAKSGTTSEKVTLTGRRL